MKNRKAIFTLIFAAMLGCIALIFKENMSKVIYYALCIIGFIMACVATYIENKKNRQEKI